MGTKLKYFFSKCGSTVDNQKWEQFGPYGGIINPHIKGSEGTIKGPRCPFPGMSIV